MFVVMERINRLHNEVVETFETEKEAYNYINNLDQMLLEQNIFTGKTMWRYFVESAN